MSLPEYLLRLGDDRLILGHRMSEWCGHGPILEEDIALANTALDLIGQANLFLELAGQVEGKRRTADALAYFREGVEFRNALIMELPRGDFAFTTARQFLVSVFELLHLDRLQTSKQADVAGIAAKAVKETRYHARHAADWMLKLGDGTTESHQRVQSAVDDLWRFTGELFEVDDIERALTADGIAADRGALRAPWREEVARVLTAATLTVPDDGFMQRGGREGKHTDVAGIAAKALKETRYHARHAADWMLKLGDGTAESRERVQSAVEDLWRFTGELFEVDDIERVLTAEGIAVDRASLRGPWHAEVSRVLSAATLTVPDDGFMQRGGREGKHTEHLGHLLAEMQIVARSFPGAEW